ncbi:MAG: YfcE family phosphodiesterase [Desulfobulbaceae bacterium A2]|nr:MAG: YfcE family phosphodiesterase [Desulfobulbaceae bacterium A2]
MKILFLSDIHGNYPALMAVERHAQTQGGYDLAIHCGDATVYAPFPNEVLDWLKQYARVSLLGNTDLKVGKLLRGKTFKKPSSMEKRVMYTKTAEQLTADNRDYLSNLPQQEELEIGGLLFGCFHGSPGAFDEHLFADTSNLRFKELAGKTPAEVILCGHSHTPFHKKIKDKHFINAGSVGRMFDGNPDACYAMIYLNEGRLTVRHHRVSYDVEAVAHELARQLLPPIYSEMFRQGRKLN